MLFELSQKLKIAVTMFTLWSVAGLAEGEKMHCIDELLETLLFFQVSLGTIDVATTVLQCFWKTHNSTKLKKNLS